jgi:hypothetical protein
MNPEDRIKRINEDGYFTKNQIHAMASQGWDITYRIIGPDICEIVLKEKQENNSPGWRIQIPKNP